MLLDRRGTTTAAPTGRWVVPLLSALFVPLWASGFIVGKIATGHMPVPTVLLWRLAIGLAVMSAVVAVVRPGRPRGRAWLHLAVTALLLQVGQFSFVYTGLSHGVPAGLTSLITGMAPLLVGLLTPLVLATRLGVAPVLGLLIGAGGVYIVLSDGLVGGLGPQVVFPVLGMLALTAGTLYQKKFNDSTPVSTSVAVQMLTSLVATAVAMPFLGVDWLPHDLAGWTGDGLARGLQLGRRVRVDVPAAAVAVDGARQRAAEPCARHHGAGCGAGAGRGAHRAGGAGPRGGADRHVRRARPRAQAARGHHLRIGPPV